MLMVCCARVILAALKLLVVLRRVYGESCVKLGLVVVDVVLSSVQISTLEEGAKGIAPRSGKASHFHISLTNGPMSYSLYASLHAVRSTF